MGQTDYFIGAVVRKLANWLDSYVEYTDNSEPPILFKKWCAISTIAAALQRKCWLDWNAKTFPNMYIVLVGPPATRKGTAMNPAEDMLRTLDIKMSASATTKEALIKALKETECITNLKNGDISLHSSLTIFSKELTVFLGQSNYGLLSQLTDWFDCADNWSYHTKSEGVAEIKGIFANLIGATTPDLIRTSLPMDAIGGGFTSRIIFVYEEKKGKVVPFPTPTLEEMKLRELLLRDLEAIHNLNGPFKTTPAFLNMWGNYYIGVQDERLFPVNVEQHFGGYIERRGIHALKLSMILNAARGDSMLIDDCDLSNALNLLAATERKMPRVFAGIGKGRDAEVYAKMVRYLNESKECTIAELIAAFRSDATQSELNATANSLVLTGIAKFTDRLTGRIAWIGGDK